MARTRIRMLHIGKTGGTTLKSLLRVKRAELDAGGLIVRGANHGLGMRSVLRKGEDAVIVFVRHPVSRFVSAFNSRLREGRPRHSSKWNQAEEIAFSLFQQPNALAEAISSDDRNLATAAQLSMISIRHVRDPQTNWLVSARFLDRHRNAIFYLGVQETMDEDLVLLFQKLGVAMPTPKDEDRHATPEQFSKHMSELAKQNILKWFAEDVALYEWCVANKSEINARPLSR